MSLIELKTMFTFCEPLKTIMEKVGHSFVVKFMRFLHIKKKTSTKLFLAMDKCENRQISFYDFYSTDQQ